MTVVQAVALFGSSLDGADLEKSSGAQVAAMAMKAAREAEPVLESITDHQGKKIGPDAGTAILEVGKTVTLKGNGFGIAKDAIDIVLYEDQAMIDQGGAFWSEVGTLAPESVSMTELTVKLPKDFPKMKIQKHSKGVPFRGRFAVRKQLPPAVYSFPQGTDKKEGKKPGHVVIGVAAAPASIAIPKSTISAPVRVELRDSVEYKAEVAKQPTFDMSVGSPKSVEPATVHVGHPITVYGNFTSVDRVVLINKEEPTLQYRISLAGEIKTVGGERYAKVQVPPRIVAGNYRLAFEGEFGWSDESVTLKVRANEYRITTGSYEVKRECSGGGSDELHFLWATAVDDKPAKDFHFDEGGFDDDDSKDKDTNWVRPLVPRTDELKYERIDKAVTIGLLLLEEDDEEWEDVEAFVKDVIEAVTEYQAEALALAVGGVAAIANQNYAAGAVMLVAAGVLVVIDGIAAADTPDFIGSGAFTADVTTLFANTKSNKPWLKPGFEFDNYHTGDNYECHYVIGLRVLRKEPEK